MRFVKTIPAFSNNQQNNGIFAKQFCLTNTWQKNFYKLKSSAFFPCPHKAGGGRKGSRRGRPMTKQGLKEGRMLTRVEWKRGQQYSAPLIDVCKTLNNLLLSSPSSVYLYWPNKNLFIFKLAVKNFHWKQFLILFRVIKIGISQVL